MTSTYQHLHTVSWIQTKIICLIIYLELKNTDNQWRDINDNECLVQFRTEHCLWVLFWKTNIFFDFSRLQTISRIGNECTITKKCTQRFKTFYRTINSINEGFKIPSSCECNYWKSSWENLNSCKTYVHRYYTIDADDKMMIIFMSCQCSNEYQTQWTWISKNLLKNAVMDTRRSFIISIILIYIVCNF